MTLPHDPTDNRLLAALMAAGGPHWRQHAERVDLKRGQVLYEPGSPQRRAYFPTSAVVSLLYVTASGASAEIAVVGNEGMVGTPLFMGDAATTGHGSVLIAGQGFRIAAQVIRDEFARSIAVRHLLLRYTQALLTQIAQTAVCNRHHSIDQQVCGWLLHSLDRLRGSDVVVTQELIAGMLGVRREGVTKVAGQLQAAGLIACTRGHVSVLDRAGLERRACECHAVVKREYDRLLPREPAARPAPPLWQVSPAGGDRAPIRPTPRPEVAAAWE